MKYYPSQGKLGWHVTVGNLAFYWRVHYDTLLFAGRYTLGFNRYSKRFHLVDNKNKRIF